MYNNKTLPPLQQISGGVLGMFWHVIYAKEEEDGPYDWVKVVPVLLQVGRTS